MYRTLILIAGLLALAVSVRAAEVPALEQYLENEITTLDGAVDAAATAAAPYDEAWYLRNFWLRVRPRAGFEIPGIAKIEIIPEAELLWQRPLPEGWQAYKPR